MKKNGFIVIGALCVIALLLNIMGIVNVSKVIIGVIFFIMGLMAFIYLKQNDNYK
ncbi:MAG: hypothetical protein L3J34_11625 [Flavobacteriaceae bacterium]|nr:hypothetical protein [Flavobacteriaceae bacterium]